MSVILAAIFGFMPLFNVSAMSSEAPLPPTSPTCQFTSASGYEGAAPFTVTLTAPYVNSGNYNWHFGDNSKGETEQTVTHTFNGVGRYTISLVVIDNQHLYRGCQTEVNVTASVDGTFDQPFVPGQPDGQWDIPSHENDLVPTSESTTVTASSQTITTDNDYFDGTTITGNNNTSNAPVINGDNNSVVIQQQQPQAEVVVQQPVVTQKTNWLTAPFHALLKAAEVFFQTLDESLFTPVLVQ